MGVPVGPGTMVAGRYRLEQLLGEGGFGAVFRAVDAQTGGPLALKILTRDAVEVGARFRREAELAMRLSHPNTVRTLDAGEDPSAGPYIVLELLEGVSLEGHLENQGPLAPRRAAEIAVAVLASLEEAHGLGIIHRDIKPANVFLVRTPQPAVKVLDFGIAKSTNADTRAGLTREGQTIGTPAYMAPEQVSGGAPGPGTDLYALGLVLAEAIHGRPVYDGRDGLAVLVDKLHGKPAPLPASLVGSILEPVVVRAVSPERGDRYPSAAAMREALEQALREMPDETYGPGMLRAPRSPVGTEPEQAARGAREGDAAEGAPANRPEPGLADTVGSIAVPIPANHAGGTVPSSPAAHGPAASSTSSPFGAAGPAASSTPSSTPSGDSWSSASLVPSDRRWSSSSSSAASWSAVAPSGNRGTPPPASPPPGMAMYRAPQTRSPSALVGCLAGGAVGLLALFVGTVAVLWYYLSPDVSTTPAPAPPRDLAPPVAPAAAEPPPREAAGALRGVACPRLEVLTSASINAAIWKAGFEVGDQSSLDGGAEKETLYGLRIAGADVGALLFYEGPSAPVRLQRARGDHPGDATFALAGRRLLFISLASSQAAKLVAAIC